MHKNLNDYRICLWTGKVQPHSVYRWMIEHPPVHYCQAPIVSGMQAKIRMGWMIYTRLRNLSGLPKTAPYPKNIDLLHVCQSLATPKGLWVMDMADHFLGLGYTRSYGHLNKPSFIDRVKKSLLHPHCRAVMPMNRTISDSLTKRIPEIAEKITIVEPALMAQRTESRSLDHSRPLRLLFIGNHYRMKGGDLALATWEVLHRQIPVDLTMVCSGLPDAVRVKYAKEHHVRFLPDISSRLSRIGGQLGLPYRQGLSEENISNLFEWADIFFLPEWMDSLAVYLEAKAYGLPVVASRAAYAADLIHHGKTGLLIPMPYSVMGKGLGIQWNSTEAFVKHIRSIELEPLACAFADAIASYWQKPAQYCTHSNASLAEVVSGRFSLKLHNNQLRSIYKNALQ